MIFAYLLFFGLVVGLATLPLLPAIREWRWPTDTMPLNVAQHSEVDIRYLANRFRSWVGEHLSRPLALCRQTASVQEGEHDGSRYVVVPDAQHPYLTEAERRSARTDRAVLSCGDLLLPDGLVAAQEIYAEGSVSGGAKTVCRAILACRDIALGPGSRTLRWLHADGSVRLGTGSHAHGRVSADHLIHLDEDCEFERLRARRVEFGIVPPDTPRPAAGELPLLEASQARQGAIIEVGAGRWLVKGNLEIPGDVRVETDLVVTGKCRIRRGAVLIGSVKSHEDLVLEDEVEVRGSGVTERDLRVGPRCRIHGPLIAERTMHLASGVVVGDPDHPTTVSALDLAIDTGTVVHGTVWAHRRGTVVTAASATGAVAPREAA